MKAHGAQRLTCRRLVGRINALKKEHGAEPSGISYTALADLAGEVLPTRECSADVIEVSVGRDTLVVPGGASSEQAIARVEQHLRGATCTRIATDLAPLAIGRMTSL